MTPATKLVIISPVRNEAENLGKTISSVISQSLPPLEWIIVDDGSSDSTPQLALAAAAANPWIRLVRRSDRGFRKSGSGVMDAFSDGLREVRITSWDFLAKLDGDLSFGPDTFAEISRAFSANPRLGICGGDVYFEKNGQAVIESQSDPAFHVRGATKFYRRACWDQMEGLIPVTGWDTLDEVKANMLGWATRRTPKARFLHLRPTGAADGGWKNAVKNGRGSYIAGFHPLFLLGKCAKRMTARPVLIQSLGLFTGFFSCYFGGVEQIQDRALVRYLREQQLRRLLGRTSIWR